MEHSGKKWLLEISEYSLEKWKKYCPHYLSDDVLVLALPYNRIVPRNTPISEIPNLDEYIEQSKKENIAEEQNYQTVFRCIAKILQNEDIDWSVDSGGDDSQYGITNQSAWNDWLSKGAGKILNTMLLPPSIYIDVRHYSDFIYEYGDCYDFEPFELSDLTDEQALKLLLILEQQVEHGMCYLYRDLRKRFGVPYPSDDNEDIDSERWQLDVDTITMLAEKYFTH